MSEPGTTSPASPPVLCVGDIAERDIAGLLRRYGLTICLLADDQRIDGSFWGEPEAGIAGEQIRLRRDTPVHSLLHELCHLVCMTPDRRQTVSGNAGGDDLEEAAVCYLQILLADELDGVGRERLLSDMDSWGYSFRLGESRRWFEEDAEDARAWLQKHGLLDAAGAVQYRLRGA